MQRVKGVERRDQGSAARVRRIETEEERSLRRAEERLEDGSKMACEGGSGQLRHGGEGGESGQRTGRETLTAREPSESTRLSETIKLPSRRLFPFAGTVASSETWYAGPGTVYLRGSSLTWAYGGR